MTTFVLTHGGGMGGWTWKFVRPLLQDAGHQVYTPTFTGFGERIHLLSRDVDNATHVADIVNVLKFEDISDCIVVGHSYAGTVLPGVNAIAGKQVRRYVFLDALITRPGESVAEALGYMSREQAQGTLAMLRSGQGPVGSGVHEQQREMAKKEPFLMSPERQQWLLDHLSDMPFLPIVNPQTVAAETIKAPVDYVAATQTIMKPMHERARALGWRMHEIEGDHAFLVGEPEATAKLLLSLV
jgi:pimeloyl-ACP methyl ester carboxylesterase